MLCKIPAWSYDLRPHFLLLRVGTCVDEAKTASGQEAGEPKSINESSSQRIIH